MRELYRATVTNGLDDAIYLFWAHEHQVPSQEELQTMSEGETVEFAESIGCSSFEPYQNERIFIHQPEVIDISGDEPIHEPRPESFGNTGMGAAIGFGIMVALIFTGFGILTSLSKLPEIIKMIQSTHQMEK